MKALIIEIIGWLGYLQRPNVVWQLVVVAILISLVGALSKSRLWGTLPRSIKPLMGPGLTLVVTLVLRALAMPTGLVAFSGWAWFGWGMLNLLERALKRLLPAQRVHELHSRLLRPFYLLAVALLLIQQLDSLQDLAVITVGQLFGVELTLGTVFQSLVITYLLLIGSGPPAAALAWILQQLIGYSDGSRKALELILRYAVIGVGITAVGFQIGLNGTALVAIAGGLSVGLGFGIKEVFSNFISGIWLLFEGSVRPGEVLMVDGDPCEVRRLGLRATLLWRDRDNAELLIPNQNFFTDQATTYTASDRMRRSEIRIHAALHHDPRIVLALLEHTALEVPRVLNQPPPRALQVAYDDYAITYSLRYWIANPMNNIGIISEVNQAIWIAFQREGIEIPLPQRVNTIRDWPTLTRAPDAGDSDLSSPH